MKKSYAIIGAIIIVLLFIFCDPFNIQTKVQYHFSQDSIKINNKEYKKLGIAGDYIVYYDRATPVTGAFSKIYEDEENRYYLYTGSGGCYLFVNRYEVLGLMEALEKGKVSIKDLENVIDIYTEPKTDN